VGIWAVKGTIALRNILLGVGTLISLYYCYQYFKLNKENIPFKNYIPIIMLGSMFCWVIFHYFFLSRFPDIQLHELKSTWLRTLLAVIVGFGTGLAILRRPNAVNLLWLGILVSFAYLFYQYIPLAISINNIHYRGYEQFIYPGKINGVLAGILLIAGLLGTLLDRYSNANFKTKIFLVLFWLIGSCVVFYAYVYIFDTRNGVGLGALIFGLVLLMLLLKIFFSLFSKPDRKIVLKNGLFILALISIVCWFGWQQFKVNSGWLSTIEDAKVAVQIEKYPNWQNPRVLGNPQTELGRQVVGNTYERISWATAGIFIFVPENLLGVGILSKPFGVLLNAKYPNSGNYIVSTHSAWVELTLAFGIPALIFTLGALLITLFLSIANKGFFKYLPSILSITVILVYAVGEISSQHSIEILYFWIALLATCLFPSVSKGLKNH
jgi:hypothetical protein